MSAVRMRTLAELNPELLRGERRRGGLLAALRAAAALLRTLLAARGMS